MANGSNTMARTALSSNDESGQTKSTSQSLTSKDSATADPDSVNGFSFATSHAADNKSKKGTSDAFLLRFSHAKQNLPSKWPSRQVEISDSARNTSILSRGVLYENTT